MDGRPPKRQRRAVQDKEQSKTSSSVDTEPQSPPQPEPVTLSSRPKTTRSRAAASATRAPSASPTKSKPKSLHGFFSAASEGQRWSAQKFEAKRPASRAATPTTTFDVNDIEDDIEDDYGSYDEIFSQVDVSSTADQKPPPQKPSRTLSKRTTTTRPKSQPSKRFLMSPASNGSANKQPKTPASTPIHEDTRPWAQRFGPVGLDELAVHKRKVSDVQQWLDDVFEGRRKEKLLVLRGPAGCGKTTTISLLSEALGYDIIEWRNPPVPEHTSRDYVSSSAQFEEFLGRGDRFGGLDLQDSASTSVSADSKKTNNDTTTPSRNRRVLLVEEFPTVLNRNSSSLAAFRTSLQRYLAASASDDQSSWSGWMHPPIVMVVSETMLTSASSISDNLTVHRLLGPTLYNHPGTTIIDFNSIAATFMQKALRTVLEKEASISKRIRIPGPAALTRIAEIGDIRSAISSLEFLCLKGDTAGSASGSAAGTWGGRLTKKKSRADADKALTPMEQESLELISQREASLGMFHAVGKIVYNKRLDPSLVSSDSVILPPPPDHLVQHRRPKVSQVAVDELVDETGTDISTFTSALHENYPPSCDGPNFVDSLNACIEALSDSDILGADRRSTLRTRGGLGMGANLNAGGVDMLRQDEISFQVASRGLLFALPYPVKRKLTPTAGQGRPGDAYKMLYPSSLRLWRKTEEIDGLVDAWMQHLLDPTSNSSSNFQFSSRHDGSGSATGEMSGVSAWRNRRLGYPDDHPERTVMTTMMRRHDVLLDQLPYMAMIKRDESDAWQLRQITSIRGSRLDGDEGEDEEEDLVPLKKSNNSGSSGPSLQPLAEDKLILSDDDIED
ncbi:hypothetical protein N7509_014047 [Penicillium cosmopolitanum]|uniref:Checkpoint protein RAD24-like helical bundle domain-containing protein n=1 Tax=Penicillium cosmopolitanum TaxID=1131564 RepID=A0A9W9S177_9EURO|nr:uncharacterized protein N7509_014047 [Penicillium cosmopolitanum]KAJ5369435.1 hypothetical protein N7509_014047 [Penicillium cosmopolitanum]